MIIFLSLLIFILNCGCVVYASKKWGAFSVPTFFVVGLLIYNSLIPLKLLLTGDYFYSIGPLSGTVTEVQCFGILWMALFANLFFIFGYASAIGSQPCPISKRQSGAGDPFKMLAGACFLGVLIGVGFLVVFYRFELRQSLSGYVGNYTVVYAAPVYSLCVTLTQTYSVMTAVLLARSNKKKHIAIWCMFAVPFIWGVLTSDKNPILLSSLGVMFSYFWGKANKYLLVFVASIFLGLSLLPVFSAYRAGVSLSDMNFREMTFMPGDPEGPFLSLIAALENDLPPETSYYISAINLVPRFIWPDRPLDAANVFARNNSRHWVGGEGLGFSLLGEAYFNLGGLFVLSYLVLGVSFAKLINYESKVSLAPIISCYAAYEALLCHRTGIMGLLKPMIYFFIPLAMSILFYTMLRGVTNRRVGV